MTSITRIVRLALDGRLVRPSGPRAASSAPMDTLRSWGGVGAAVAEVFDACVPAGHGEGGAGRAEPPFVVAVGSAVRDGLPTAGRATVLARAPLTGRLGQGQVGGSLGARLARTVDALVLQGRTELPGAVLVWQEGQAQLVSMPELVGQSPAETSKQLAQRFGPHGALVVGPGGERGVHFASLASEGLRPSFVGRGGLGLAFATLGLKALVVLDDPVAEEGSAPDTGKHGRAHDLVRALARSPRLAERAASGTFELLHAHAARGELRDKEGSPLDTRDALRLADEARAAASERKGCRGCPTPCGWVFERAGGGTQRAHFGAAEALGARLGLTRFEDALELLATCDALGLDAKEAGAVLLQIDSGRELGRWPGEHSLGDLGRLRSDLHRLLERDWSVAAKGASALAEALELTGDSPQAPEEEAPGIERGLAARLARLVGTGGSDPMRSFPFLLEVGGHERVAALTGIALEEPALDPHQPQGKGALVWWHENLVAAVDLVGFCAFSTAGLLADGVLGLDELALFLLPSALRDAPAWKGEAPGAQLLAAGASLVLARQLVDRAMGATVRHERWSSSKGARDEGLEFVLREYAAHRGWAGDGAPTEAAYTALGTPRLAQPMVASIPNTTREARPARESFSVSQSGSENEVTRRRGRVLLHCGGALAAAFGAELVFETDLPCSLDELLVELAADHEDGGLLVDRTGRLLPSVWREGRRLRGAEPVHDGDRLDLIAAIAGG